MIPDWPERRKERSSFLQKRTKKLLRGCRGLAGDSRVKVFASFSKKQRLLASPVPRIAKIPRGRCVVSLCAICALPAQAAPARVAVADFDYVDSSGEVANQQAVHADRLRELKADIIASISQNGQFTGVALTCGKPPCAAGNMDQDAISSAARAQHAQFLVFGGVHKVSTLIQWGQMVVMDVATGKAVLARTVSFRGDSNDAWKHAADYLGQMVVTALP